MKEISSVHSTSCMQIMGTHQNIRRISKIELKKAAQHFEGIIMQSKLHGAKVEQFHDEMNQNMRTMNRQHAEVIQELEDGITVLKEEIEEKALNMKSQKRLARTRYYIMKQKIRS